MTAAASVGDLLAGVATWSAWVPFSEAVQSGPREAGVYLARQGAEVLYGGMAGPRDRGGKAAPKGLRGRLAFYGSGKALASGLGEAVVLAVITVDEDLRLAAAGLSRSMPPGWDGRDPFDRFRMTGLDVDAFAPRQTALGTGVERQIGVDDPGR